MILKFLTVCLTGIRYENCFDNCIDGRISHSCHVVYDHCKKSRREDAKKCKKNPERVNKDIMIRVRVTAEEREKFTVMAKEKGYKSVSEFIRSLVADEKKPARS